MQVFDLRRRRKLDGVVLLLLQAGLQIVQPLLVVIDDTDELAQVRVELLDE